MATKEVAIKKRAMIDSATQTMLLAVCLASIALGCALVLSIYFTKWIVFNTKVIAEKGMVIEDFKTVQNNIRTLTANVDELADNENLEVVARVRENRCTALGGGAIDTTNNLELSRICSALRVIPDALPSTQNNEAVYASLNKLFLETKNEGGTPVEPEYIGSGNEDVYGLNLPAGLNATPVALLIENTAFTTRAVLDTVERSIRNYDILKAMITWRRSGEEGSVLTDMIELRGNAVAYYTDAMVVTLKTKTIYADDEKNANTAGAKR